MKIAIAGTGYVGLSLAVLLARKNTVQTVDIIAEKVALINEHKSPIVDKEIEEALAHGDLNLVATLDAAAAYREADYIIIATPTNYDVGTRSFDTSSIESVLSLITEVNTSATVVIKSTVPVGYLEHVRTLFPTLPNLLFSPEFLREGRALYDNLHPSRIIVGIPEHCSDSLQAKAVRFAELLSEGAESSNVPVRIVHATEAESIKLFANTYLALRVAYFNELDTYAEEHGLDAAEIIEGVCLDPRIGNHYNNPSFGYGGYCLPKDTRQLEANFRGTPSALIPAVVAANDVRKNYILSRILKRNPKVVGIYRLIMKAKSDNFRQSAIQDVLHGLRKAGIAMLIYEPMEPKTTFDAIPVMHDLEKFADQCDVIVANRVTEELTPWRWKVYTRDLFSRD